MRPTDVLKNLMDVYDTNENMQVWYKWKYAGVLFQQQKHQLINKYTSKIKIKIGKSL